MTKNGTIIKHNSKQEVFMNTKQENISIRDAILNEAKNLIDSNNLFLFRKSDDKSLNSMLCFSHGSFFHLTGGWSAKSINIDELRPATEQDLNEAINQMNNLKAVRVNLSDRSFNCFDDGLRINGLQDGQVTPFMPINEMLKFIKLNKECHDINIDSSDNISFTHGGELFLIKPSKLSPVGEKLYECSVPELVITESNLEINTNLKNKMKKGNEHGNSFGI